MSRRWAWQVMWSLIATVISLYIAYLATHFYGIGPTAYEPKDFERQRLYEQTGKSTIDQSNRR